MTQQSFHSLAYANKKKATRFDVFLGEMDKATPWRAMAAIVEPHYPKAGNGRQPYALMSMIRIYCLQLWYNLSDPAMEDWLYAVTPVRQFAGLELGVDAIPDETTILNFRHLLERHGLQEQIFEQIKAELDGKGLLLKEGTIVDATIIAAPSSTKNEKKQRDPEMSSTKKGNQWHFGMKMHIGATTDGIVHDVKVTTASEHDSQALDDLLHGEEQAVYGDKAYADKERAMEFAALGIDWRILRKGSPHAPLNEKDKAWNRRQSKVRAFVEHPFLVVKKLWGHAKTRYRGLKKNGAQMFMLFGLANIYKLRKTLIATV